MFNATFIKKHTFANGKTVNVYTKETKKGTRFYYQSGGRLIPTAASKVNA